MKRASVLCCLTILQIVATNAVIENDSDDDYVEEMNCLPQLADNCFTNIYKDLDCYFNPQSPPSCKNNNNAETLCRDIGDSLECAKDEIDSSCKEQEGRFEFDAWIKGLDAISRNLCSSNFKKMKLLLNASICWNSVNFLNCVENEAKIGHVVDLLHTKLTWNTCSHFMLALSTCNVRATIAARSCQLPQGIITDAIHAFFTNTDCGQEMCLLSSSTIFYKPNISIVLVIILTSILRMINTS